MAGSMSNLADYIKLYDSAFTSRLRGSDAGEIATLESLTGQTLPETYRQFLSLLGHSDDEFALASLGSTDISVIIEYYNDVMIGEATPPPPDCIVIGTGDLSAGNICLQLQGGEEPKVVFAMDQAVTRLYSENLEKLLFRCAFNKHRLKKMSHSAIYTGTDTGPLLTAATAVALQLEIKPHWFSDEVAFCGENERAGILLLQYQRRGIWIRLSAGSRSDVEEMGDEFQGEIGVKFSHWLD